MFLLVGRLIHLDLVRTRDSTTCFPFEIVLTDSDQPQLLISAEDVQEKQVYVL